MCVCLPDELKPMIKEGNQETEIKYSKIRKCQSYCSTVTLEFLALATYLFQTHVLYSVILVKIILKQNFKAMSKYKGCTTVSIPVLIWKTEENILEHSC